MASAENTTCNSSNISIQELLKDVQEVASTLKYGLYPAFVMAGIGLIFQVILVVSVGYVLYRGKLPWKRFSFVINQCCADLIFLGLFSYAAVATVDIGTTTYNAVFQKDQSKTLTLGLLFGIDCFIMMSCAGNYSLIIHFQSLALHKPVYYAIRLTKTNVILHICAVWCVTLGVSSFFAAASSNLCSLISKTCFLPVTVIPMCLVTLAILFCLINYLHIIAVLRSRIKTQQKLQEIQLDGNRSGDSEQNADRVTVNLLNYFCNLMKITKGLRTNLVLFGLSIIVPVSLLWILIFNVVGDTFISGSGFSECEQKRILLQEAIHFQSSSYFRIFSITGGPLLLLRILADPVIYFVEVPELNQLLNKYWTFFRYQCIRCSQ